MTQKSEVHNHTAGTIRDSNKFWLLIYLGVPCDMPQNSILNIAFENSVFINY